VLTEKLIPEEKIHTKKIMIVPVVTVVVEMVILVTDGVEVALVPVGVILGANTMKTVVMITTCVILVKIIAEVVLVLAGVILIVLLMEIVVKIMLHYVQLQIPVMVCVVDQLENAGVIHYVLDMVIVALITMRCAQHLLVLVMVLVVDVPVNVGVTLGAHTMVTVVVIMMNFVLLVMEIVEAVLVLAGVIPVVLHMEIVV